MKNSILKKTMNAEKELFKTLTIPVEVIFDQILPRLPVKSLTRFKSVCKNWYCLISSPQFAKSHLHYSSSSPHFFISKESCDHEDGTGFEAYSVAYDKHNNLNELVQLDSPWGNEGLCTIDIVGCCNGLVCFYMIEEHYLSEKDYLSEEDDYVSTNLFAIWNPATHEYRKIKVPLGISVNRRGFGCTSALNDYKIVFSGNTRLWIFSLRVGEWKQIDLPSDYGSRFFMGSLSGVFLDDTLYWNASECKNPCSERLFSFNLVDEQFSEVPLMVPGGSSSTAHATLYVIKGCLSLFLYEDNVPDVLVLRPQGDCKSWEKLFSFRHIPSIHCHGFTHTGKCLVEDERSKLIKLVDPTLEDLEHSQGIVIDGSLDSAHQHVESLISPLATVVV